MALAMWFLRVFLLIVCAAAPIAIRTGDPELGAYVTASTLLAISSGALAVHLRPRRRRVL